MEMRKNMAYTEESKRQFDFLLREDLTAEETVAYLKTDFSIRQFSDVLEQLYAGEDMERRLTEAFDSRKTVQNWLKNRNLPTNREQVFCIAFALGLSEYGADELLSYVFGDGIHYRNERELLYAFALKNHQTYAAATASAKKLEERSGTGETGEALTTQDLRLAFEQLPPGADYMKFLMEHQNSFGTLHDTAYRYFINMLSYLEDIDETGNVYSTEYICDSYLRMGVPLTKRVSSYSTLQKMVKKYWPGVRSVKAMKRRSEDVSRKILILLYLVTGGVREQSYDEEDEDYIDAEKILLGNLTRIDQMMTDCGMRTIDPRNPFDFLVLYCLKTDMEDSMSERMEEILSIFFGN
jgi:hypothetical protein